MKSQILVKRLFDGVIIVTILAAMTQTASARISAPDVACTSGLVGIACCGLLALRRFLR
jgi:uncharacterized MnhB-related membrane protein